MKMCVCVWGGGGGGGGRREEDCGNGELSIALQEDYPTIVRSRGSAAQWPGPFFMVISVEVPTVLFC